MSTRAAAVLLLLAAAAACCCWIIILLLLLLLLLLPIDPPSPRSSIVNRRSYDTAPHKTSAQGTRSVNDGSVGPARTPRLLSAPPLLETGLEPLLGRLGGVWASWGPGSRGQNLTRHRRIKCCPQALGVRHPGGLARGLRPLPVGQGILPKSASHVVGRQAPGAVLSPRT